MASDNLELLGPMCLRDEPRFGIPLQTLSNVETWVPSSIVCRVKSISGTGFFRLTARIAFWIFWVFSSAVLSESAIGWDVGGEIIVFEQAVQLRFFLVAAHTIETKRVYGTGADCVE